MMKTYFSFLFIVLFLALLQSPLFSQAKTAIAVLSFEAKNTSQETADAVSDILSTELFNTNRFQVIERQAISKMLEEQKLQMAGITDMSRAAEIGKVLNVEKIMIGSVSKLGKTFIINTRLVNVETGALDLAQNVKCIGEDGLPGAIANLVATIAQKITVEGSIIKITPKVILIDLGKNHGVRPGQVLEVIRIGDVVTDLSGAIIGKTEDKIGLLQVINIRKEYSEAKVLKSKINFRLGDKVRLSTTPIESNKKPKVKKKRSRKKTNDNKKPVAPPPVF
ncbi:MAG: hypothetical protein GXO75_18425 [Calditrichaeota bacterium]|nr:hypothetical protein [Calditrichota bacterium]